ncbi:Crp/Fnr family transcriptional regulator [Micromonospora aurantiaca]|uniref:Crp/Fnr family transcriptional regulator n=1 Tax=Micromonospora aurantiaca (nom. illeg.) TaxID=47850 RepID=UPI003452383A
MAQLPAQTRAEMIALGVERRYRVGDVLLKQGMATREMLLLLDGFVKVTAESGTEHVLLTIRAAGDPVGDLAAMSGQLRSATVTACTPVTARFVLPHTLQAFLRHRPQVAELINALVVDQLAMANRRRVEMATLPVLDRLIGVLLDLVAICGEQQQDGSATLPNWFSQAELAALVGTSSVDTIQRQLRSLREQQLIESGYRKITILDPDKLAALRVRPHDRE